MINFFLSLFNERVILLRTAVYGFGWTLLVITTIISIYRSVKLNKRIKGNINFIIPVLIGWFISMYSLAIVCTFYVFDFPRKGMIVTFPIFLAWLITIILVFKITTKWIKEAVEQYKKMNELNKELKEANRSLKQLDKFKSDFVTITTHQLRTPLSEVKWALNALIKGELGDITDEQKELTQKAYKSNGAVIAMVNELLETKKAEKENWGYKFEKKPIEIIARDVMENFYLTSQEKKINLVLEKAETSMPDIIIDAKKIKIALSVLVENALHYSPERSEVKIKLENLGDKVQVSVEDRGIGISEEEKERVFSSFFRGKDAFKKRTEGSGIGLYIAKNIIESHQGKIWFESEKGKGTIFYFTLPFEK